ncbi:MAG TPA: DUF4199 domain-containing protein [Gemmatimonadaceae bacterium]
MKRTVLTFGLIAGAIMSIEMIVGLPFIDEIGSLGVVVGYATMVVAFLMIYFGIRSYRDGVAGGSIGFGRAFGVGILITLIACICYVATWEVIFYKFTPDFFDKYSARVLAQTKESGATAAQIEVKRRELAIQGAEYKKPLVNIAYTFIEPFPVGLVFTLVCAALLRRRRPGEPGRASFATAGPSPEPN